MNEENDKHEFNFFLDKQIQQKLLEAHEELTVKETQLLTIQRQPSFLSGKIKGNGLNGSLPSSVLVNQASQNGKVTQKSLTKELQSLHISGWCPDPAINYRKTENDASVKAKANNNSTNNSIKDVSRDSKSRAGLPQDFVFRHYADPRRYIEQYRREHTCLDTSNSSATRNEFLESRRFYAYNQYSPLAVSIHDNTYQQNATIPSQQESIYQQNIDQLQKIQQAQSMQYSSKRDLQKQAIINASLRSNSSPQQYKLTKTPTFKSENSQILAPLAETPEGAEINEKKRAGSAKERYSPTVNGISISKTVATKMNGAFKANSGGLSARTAKPSVPSTFLDTSMGNQFVSHKLGYNSVGQMRTFDTLANAAGIGSDKQTVGVEEAVDSSSSEQTEQRLALLRRVNQRPAKPRQPQPHLTFYKDIHVQESEKQTHVAKEGPNIEKGEPKAEMLESSLKKREPNVENLDPNMAPKLEKLGLSMMKREPNLENLEPSMKCSLETYYKQNFDVWDELNENYSKAMSTQSQDNDCSTTKSSMNIAQHMKRRGRPKYRNEVNVADPLFQHDISVVEHEEREKKSVEKEQCDNGRKIDKESSKDTGSIEEVLTVTAPSWKERTMMALSEKAQEKLPGVRGSVKTRRKLDDRASLSHKRRIQHIIEQSRLKSRFGQLLGASALTAEISERYKEYIEPNPKDSDVSSRTYVPEAWSPRKGADITHQDNSDSTSLKNSVSSNARQESHHSKPKKPMRHASDGNNNNDGASETRSKAIRVKESDFVSNEYSKPELLGQDLLQCSGIKPNRTIPILYSEAMGELNVLSSNQIKTYVPMPVEKKKVTTMSEKYIDKLSEKVSSDVCITVPELRYSKVGSIARSQTMHF